MEPRGEENIYLNNTNLFLFPSLYITKIRKGGGGKKKEGGRRGKKKKKYFEGKTLPFLPQLSDAGQEGKEKKMKSKC